MGIFDVFKRISNATKLLLIIVLLIGFQQFPVIYIGGSFKIYELLGLILFFLYGIKWEKDFLVVLMFLFFVVSPIISLALFYLFDDVSSYYRIYPNVRSSFRHNIYIFPILQLLFMFVNYVVLYNIYVNKELYKNFNIVIKWIVVVGTCIAGYSIIAMFTGDPISHLPNIIQNKHVYVFRSSGLSQEPSSYILYQGWIVLFLWKLKSVFGNKTWIILFAINVISLIFTFSSSLVLFVGVVVIVIFLISKAYMKMVYTGVLIASLWIGYMALSRYVDVQMLNYALVQKLEDYVWGREDAGGSGGFRHYESSLGWAIFDHNPVFGVGVGNSSYFMHEVAKKSPIVPLDEQLGAKSIPPNTFSCVFAEQGFFGGGTMMLMMLVSLYKFWLYRKKKYGYIFLTGALFNIGCLLAIAPQYSMYLWTFIFLALGYIRNKEKPRLCKLLQVENNGSVEDLGVFLIQKKP